MTEPKSDHERTRQPACSEQVTPRRESLIDSLGLPPGVEDAVLDIPLHRDLGRAADFD